MLTLPWQDGSEVTPIAGALFEACADLRLAHASASSDDVAALHTANSLLQQVLATLTCSCFF